MFSELPEELPEEKMSELIAAVTDESRKLGLYVNGVGVIRDEDPFAHPVMAGVDDDEPKIFKLAVSYTVGDDAFKPKVQDPETDKMDDQFREIEVGNTRDEAQKIIDRYTKKNKPQDS